jgi:hypothetical protein
MEPVLPEKYNARKWIKEGEEVEEVQEVKNVEEVEEKPRRAGEIMKRRGC